MIGEIPKNESLNAAGIDGRMTADQGSGAVKEFPRSILTSRCLRRPGLGLLPSGAPFPTVTRLGGGQAAGLSQPPRQSFRPLSSTSCVGLRQRFGSMSVRLLFQEIQQSRLRREPTASHPDAGETDSIDAFHTPAPERRRARLVGEQSTGFGQSEQLFVEVLHIHLRVLSRRSWKVHAD